MDNFKHEPLIVTKNKDGKIEFTEEELKNLIKTAYTNGFVDGTIMGGVKKEENPPNTINYPPYISPTIRPTYPEPPIQWDWNKWYCFSDVISPDSFVTIKEID